jgi:hypothetical protein
MIQGWASDPSRVARDPGVLVGSSCRGVAGWSPNRCWPGTTRCNGLAVIVMRDGEPVSRVPLIARVRQQQALSQSREAPSRVGATLMVDAATQRMFVEVPQPQLVGLGPATSPGDATTPCTYALR